MVPSMRPKTSGLVSSMGTRRATALPRLVMTISLCCSRTSSKRRRHLALKTLAGMRYFITIAVSIETGHGPVLLKPRRRFERQPAAAGGQDAVAVVLDQGGEAGPVVAGHEQ